VPAFAVPPPSAAESATQPQNPPPKNDKGTIGLQRSHTVGKGDTLYTLSRRYDTSLRDLIALNNFSPPYTLSIGQTVLIPVGKHHLVVQDDTLYSLSRRYGVSVNELARRNRITPPYVISVGQLLLLPDTVINADTPLAIAKAPPPQASAAPAAPVKKAKAPPPVPVKKPTKAVKAPPKKKKPVKAAAGKSTSPVILPGKLVFQKPVKGKIILGYGDLKNGQRNEGIDIAANQGTPIRASEGGVVVYSGRDIEAFGNLILLRHDNGFLTAYGHNEENRVQRGAKVKKGDVIATVGQTGAVGQPQLHFEIRNKQKVFDPTQYLPK
jgi:murein DD-endopeptidase MepM/ murein hydrolase activator NlpD